MTEPDLENSTEIRRLLDSGHTAKTLSGVGKVVQCLITEISKTGVESGNLTRALNRITAAGVIIALLTLFLGTLSFISEQRLKTVKKECWKYAQSWQANNFQDFDAAYKSCLREEGESN